MREWFLTMYDLVLKSAKPFVLVYLDVKNFATAEGVNIFVTQNTEYPNKTKDFLRNINFKEVSEEIMEKNAELICEKCLTLH